MSKELKRCPFCGGEAVVEMWKIDTDVTFYKVGCETCFVYFQSEESEDEAAEQWNRRAANDPG